MQEGNLKHWFLKLTPGENKSVLKNCPTQVINRNDFDAAVILRAATCVSLMF